MFLGLISVFFLSFLVNKVIPMQLPIKEVWASDLLLGDHVCEKSDACQVDRLSIAIIYLIMSC